MVFSLTLRAFACLSCSLFFSFWVAPAFAQTVQDSRFTIETLHEGAGMIAVDFAWDGRLFVAEKQGRILQFPVDSQRRGSYLTPTVFADLSSTVEDSNERGLLGLVLHPQFQTNRWVYVFYSYSGGQRLVRLTAGAGYDSAVGAAQTLLDDLPNNASNHNAGDLHWNPVDGGLYLTLGDDTSTGSVQSLDTYHGKILKLDENGQGLSSNPYYAGDTSAVRARVWARGLRNPFRFDVHPQNGVLYVSENGPSTDRVTRWSTPGSNGGWPDEFNTPSDSNVLNLTLESPSITGIAIARGGPFADPAVPGSDALYVANWRLDRIERWRLTGSQLDAVAPIEIASSNHFVTDFPEIAHLEFGPDGDLYVTTTGRSSLSGGLYRIRLELLVHGDDFESSDLSGWN